MIVTGAGVSAESGVPTFRGPGGYWRNKKVQVSSSTQDSIGTIRFLRGGLEGFHM